MTMPVTTPAASVRFDPAAASAAQRLAVGQLLADCYAVAYPDDPPLLPEREADLLLQVTPDTATDLFVSWAGDRALGYAALSYSLTQNLHTARAQLLVHPDERRRGVGRALAAALTERAGELGRTTIVFFTTNFAPAGEPFARSLGAQVRLDNRTSRLNLAAVPSDLLRDWQRRPEGDPYRLHLWDTVPDDYLARTADLMMVMNTAPRGSDQEDDWVVTPELVRAQEAESAALGERRLLLAAEDTRTGELVGYTETFWSPERAALVYQGATAVRPAARRQRLGKWLKAAMMEQLRRECPGAVWVRTSNAEENAAMLAINVQLGFQPWAQTLEWEWSGGRA
ncbi:N-acetyltransferase family protein [Deinococcus sp. PESE-13]